MKTTDPLTSYYTCIPEKIITQKEHCLKGVWDIAGANYVSVSPMPTMPFFLEKQIFEYKFPNHVLHPGLVVNSPAKSKHEIY